MAIIAETKREREILESVTEVLKNELNPQCIYLFGSRVKGTSGRYSDFDIWVDCMEPGFEVKKGLLEKIEKISGLYTVDVVFNNNDTEFNNIVKQTGVKVYEK
ncbi:MAG TPA: nucleotidyltransferase domain-containing protein [bacterium]|nr:nucleotidyltransferase domain-containing protein [bacterium]